MEEQMKQQFEQLQEGFKTMFDTGQKMMGSALHGSEVAADSFSQLTRDQFEYGYSCLDIGRRQLESLQASTDPGKLFRANGVSEFCTASMHFGEALRKNAENTCDRMADVGREAMNTAADAGSQTDNNGKTTSSESKSSSSKSKNA